MIQAEKLEGMKPYFDFNAQQRQEMNETKLTTCATNDDGEGGLMYAKVFSPSEVETQPLDPTATVYTTAQKVADLLDIGTSEQCL